jgi:hypothetical protein
MRTCSPGNRRGGSRVTVTFERLGQPELWNPNTGETSPIKTFRIEDGRLALDLDFPPSEGHIVVVKGDLPATYVSASNLDISDIADDRITGYGTINEDMVYATLESSNGARTLTAERKQALPAIDLPMDYAFSVEQPNVLVVDDWRMKLVEGESEGDWQSPEFDDSDWLGVRSGGWEMQLPQERDEATYPVTLWYRTSFEVKDMPVSGTRLMIDGFSGSEYRLWMNGEEITDHGERSYLDAEIREVDVQRYLTQGRNSVVVRLVARRKTDGMLDLLKIIGDFSVDGSSDSGYAITAERDRIDVGDWTAQGYPFFSGTGVYHAKVEVPDAHLDGGRLILEADCGEDVLDVSINGSESRIAPWHPYRLDVTDLLHTGENEIELRVTNTLLNILEGVSQASGLFSAPRIVHEHRYELK